MDKLTEIEFQQWVILRCSRFEDPVFESIHMHRERAEDEVKDLEWDEEDSHYSFRVVEIKTVIHVLGNV